MSRVSWRWNSSIREQSGGQRTIAFTDVDLTDVHSINPIITASGGALGTLTASATTHTTGSGVGGVITWNYSVADAAVEYLAANQTKLETFTITLDDGNGGTIQRTISVTITGANYAPTITAEAATPTLVDTAALDTFAAVTGQLDGADVDAGASLSYKIVGQAPNGSGDTVLAGNYGTLTVHADGSYSYAPNATAINALTAPTTDVFNVQVSDGIAAAVTTTSWVSITGTNDVPIVAAADVTGGVTELTTPPGTATLTDSGTIAFTDVDLTDTHSISTVTPSAGALGTLTATASNTDTSHTTGLGGVVTWNYSVADFGGRVSGRGPDQGRDLQL